LLSNAAVNFRKLLVHLAREGANGVALWGVMPPRSLGSTTARVAAAVLFLGACGEHGFFPTTVDPGADFGVADVVFDEGYYYCKVEPMLLVEQHCGSGDPARGEAANGCHATVTSFRLTDYMPLVADTCGGSVVPGTLSTPAIAQQNYQGAQARMRRDPDNAPLLLRPTGKAQHPRLIFEPTSPEADIIRQWATQYSTK
jgi:hypothetical protein